MWVALVALVIVLIGFMKAVTDVVVVIRMQKLIDLPRCWNISANPVGAIVA
ncbi:hypothetical protein D3C80_1629940 [compost metagenome]